MFNFAGERLEAQNARNTSPEEAARVARNRTRTPSEPETVGLIGRAVGKAARRGAENVQQRRNARRSRGKGVATRRSSAEESAA